MGAVKFFVAVKEFGQPVDSGDTVLGWSKKFPPIDIKPGYEFQIVNDDSGGGFALLPAPSGTIHQDGSGGASADDWASEGAAFSNLVTVTGDVNYSGPRVGVVWISPPNTQIPSHTVPARGDRITNVTLSTDGIAYQDFLIPNDSGVFVNTRLYWKKFQGDIV